MEDSGIFQGSEEAGVGDWAEGVNFSGKCAHQTLAFIF